MAGINYGGWFAMYPAELVRSRITLDSVPTVRALTIGAPFSPFLHLQAQCPVTIMVTDPVGNQTGVDTNGVVVEAIPLSSYQAAVSGSEDGSSVDPDGPKTVRIDTPMAGTYRIDLVGTNAGAYTLDCEQVAADGTLLETNTFTGTISLGQQVSYFVTAVPSGPPPLLLAQQAGAIALSWTTNYTGFTLQTTTNLGDTNSWSSVGGVTVVGGFNSVSVPISIGSHFFRLKR